MISPLTTIDEMRCHIPDFCVQHAIIPLRARDGQPRSQSGSQAVFLRYVPGPCGHWASPGSQRMSPVQPCPRTDGRPY